MEQSGSEIMKLRYERLDKDNAELLFEELSMLTEQDIRFFSPHGFELNQILELINETGNCYYLYYDGQKFVGYGMLRTFNQYRIPTLGCAVWESYRGSGYSKAIVISLLNQARSSGFTSVKLKVEEDNVVARELYENIGFEYTEKASDSQWWMEYNIT